MCVRYCCARVTGAVWLSWVVDGGCKGSAGTPQSSRCCGTRACFGGCFVQVLYHGLYLFAGAIAVFSSCTYPVELIVCGVVDAR